MKDSTIVTVMLGSGIVIMYVTAAIQGVNGQLFTIATNALIFLGTGKIIYDQRKIHQGE